MHSNSSSRIKNSLALRLTMWYAASFLVITVALSIISYVYLSSAVRDNGKIIQAKLKEITKIAAEHGVNSIGQFDTNKYPNYSRKGVVTRVIDNHGGISYESNPKIWKEFNSVSRNNSAVGLWQYVPSSEDRDVLEVMTVPETGG